MRVNLTKKESSASKLRAILDRSSPIMVASPARDRYAKKCFAWNLAVLQQLVLRWISTVSVTDAASCSVCHDSIEPTLPDNVVWLPGFNTAESMSCRDLDRFAPILLPDASSPACDMFRRFGSLCGCPPIVLPELDGCGGLCADGFVIDPNKSNVLLKQFGTIFPTIAEGWYTCELLDAFLVGTRKNETDCMLAQSSAAETCGCPAPMDRQSDSSNSSNVDLTVDGFADVSSLWLGLLGTAGPPQLRLLHLLTRIAALFSVLGSILVIQDCLRDSQRRSHVYNQIVGVMAVFDIVHSVAIGLQQLPRPRKGWLQHPDDGQLGNDATCTAQGWFTQWGGMTSLCLNGALSTYYVLVIIYSTKETKLKALRKWLIVPPLIAGLLIACASLPYIGPSYYGGCFIVAPYQELADLYLPEGSKSWLSYIALFLLPGWFVVLYSTVTLVSVWLHVRKVSARAKKWTFSINTGNSTSLTSHRSQPRRSTHHMTEIGRLEREVAWQSAMYLAALYFSWVLSLVIATNLKEYIASHYSLWVFFFMVSPLQGLLNSANYFRPRFSRLIQERRKSRQQRLNQNNLQEAENQESRFFRDWKIASSVEPANLLADIVENNTPEDLESTTAVEESQRGESVFFELPCKQSNGGETNDNDDSGAFSVSWKAASAVEPVNEIVRWNSAVDRRASLEDVTTKDILLTDVPEMDSQTEAKSVLSPVLESSDDVADDTEAQIK